MFSVFKRIQFLPFKETILTDTDDIIHPSAICNEHFHPLRFNSYSSPGSFCHFQVVFLAYGTIRMLTVWERFPAANVSHMCEVGFHRGRTASLALFANPSARLTVFDPAGLPSSAAAMRPSTNCLDRPPGCLCHSVCWCWFTPGTLLHYQWISVNEISFQSTVRKHVLIIQRKPKLSRIPKQRNMGHL